VAEQTLEGQVRVLTSDMEAVKRRLQRMEHEVELGDALARAARGDSLKALERIPKIEDELRAFRVEFRTGLARLETKVTGLDTKVTGLDGKVTALEATVTELNTRFTTFEATVTELNTKFTALEKSQAEDSRTLARIARHLGA
jgi:predicted  nucleic acid-binding Zn-ribbon protein